MIPGFQHVDNYDRGLLLLCDSVGIFVSWALVLTCLTARRVPKEYRDHSLRSLVISSVVIVALTAIVFLVSINVGVFG